jgi:hypothetical protein
MKSEARLGELLGPKVVSRQWSKNRVCGEEGCSAVLSRYNPSDKCSLHRSSKVLARAVEEPKDDDKVASLPRKQAAKKASRVKKH